MSCLQRIDVRSAQPNPSRRFTSTTTLLTALLAMFICLPWRIEAGPPGGREEEKPDAKGRRTPKVFTLAEIAADAGRVNIRSYLYAGGEPPKVLMLEKGGKEAANKDKKTIVVPLTELDKHGDKTLARQPHTVRFALIAGSFPYRKQIEEFRARLGLSSNEKVLEELSSEKGAGGQRLSSFRFLGVETVRREVDGDGKPISPFRVLNFTRDYRPLIVLTGRCFEVEDPPLAALSFAGLVMPRLELWPKMVRRGVDADGYPRVERRLKLLAKAIKEIRSAPPDGFEKDSSDPFSPGSDKGKAKRPAGKLPEHCLVRVIDVTVQPGRTYEYRLRIRMANPNYKRKDTASPRDAEEKELVSESSSSVKVATDPDVHYYAVDQKELQNGKDDENPTVRYKGPYTSQYFYKDRTVILQAHRWLETLAARDGSRPQPVGEWVVAERIPVMRGEYVGHNERIEVPVWRYAREKFVLATDASTSKRRPGVAVLFGYNAGTPQPEAILVDFDSEKIGYDRGRKVTDTRAGEVLLLNPDGKLVLLEGARDAVDALRVRRLTEVRKRLREVRGGEKKKKEKNPFGD